MLKNLALGISVGLLVASVGALIEGKRSIRHTGS